MRLRLASLGVLVVLALVSGLAQAPAPGSNVRINAPATDTAGPTVTITSPTSSTTYDAGTSATLDLSGTGSDARTITGCTYTNSLGGSGSATGTTGWSISAAALTVGSNVITVTCTDIVGNQGTDVLTVTRSSASSGCTVTTANVSEATVQSAVDAANDGDKVCLPAGSATWAGHVDVTDDITIEGAGAGQTIITNGGFTIGQDGCPGNAVDISGFTFSRAGSGTTVDIYCSSGWRIHHNTITYASAQDMMLVLGFQSVSPAGLFDNNTVTYGRIVVRGGPTSGSNPTADGGRYRWSEPLNAGTVTAVYVEDNTIGWPNGTSGGSLNHMDGNQGCRYVARFNTVLNGRFEAHGLQGTYQRACRLWEIYHNTLTSNGTPGLRYFLMRAGTGAIFHNTYDGGQPSDNIQIDNSRTHQDDVISAMGAWGACDDTPDTPQIDAHESGGEGYLCRDQVGASTDTDPWTNYDTDPPPTQEKQPAYIFNNTNTATGNPMPMDWNCVGNATQCTRQSTKHLVENRNWFQQAASFNGTVGIGEGPIASRPATCTVGVGYWATDEGEWNSRNPGADGKMYVCTATNTWSANYLGNSSGTPYTYPHPLQGS